MAHVVTKKSLDALEAEWAEWHEKNAADQIPPLKAITIKQYAKIAGGITEAKAGHILASKCRAGELETGLFRVDGRTTRYYWRP